MKKRQKALNRSIDELFPLIDVDFDGSDLDDDLTYVLNETLKSTQLHRPIHQQE